MRVIPAAVLSLLLIVPVAAQRRADFSGTWVLDEKRSESPLLTNGQFSVPVSVTLEIAQTENEVRIDTVRDGGREVRHYPFASTDVPQAVGTSGSFGIASESDESVPDAGGLGTAGRNGRLVSLDGNTLETITPHKVNGMTVTTTERRTLSANGREMIVVTQLVVHHGYEGSGTNVSNVSSPARDVYVRQGY